ncbi:MAG: type II secretion system F family protein [Candidatus Hydrogenedentota bacterium]
MPEQLPFMSIVAGLAMFALIASMWLMAIVIWRARKGVQEEHVRDRLASRTTRASSLESKGQVLSLWHQGEIKTTIVQGKQHVSRLVSMIDDMRNALGWTIPLPTFIMGMLGISVFSFCAVLAMTSSLLLSAIALFMLLYFVRSYAANKLHKTDMLFARQLQDSLALATRSLRAGHPLTGAFQLIADECEPPISTVFGEILQQQNLGKSLEEAIVETSNKHRSPDLKLFAASTVIQIRSGGNVADMMERLAHVIGDRMRLDRKVRVLTSQTQLSKKVLMAIPLLLFIYMYFVQPGYLEPMFNTEVGRMLIVIALVLLFVGNHVMNKIAELDY